MKKILGIGKVAIVFMSECCECINITMANINLHLKSQDFFSFKNDLRLIIAEQKLLNWENKFIAVCTPAAEVNLHFKKEEILELFEILCQAGINYYLKRLNFQHGFSSN